MSIPKPTCANCGKRKHTHRGAFCGSRCAGKFGLAAVEQSHTRCDRCGQYHIRVHCGDIQTVHHQNDPCPNCKAKP